MRLNLKLAAVFCISLFSSIGLSQDSGNATMGTSCEVIARDSKDTSVTISEWKVIKFRDLEFAVPKEFAVQNARCFEGLCLNYSRSNLRFWVDPSSAAWRPVIERKTETNYSEEITTTDNARYWSWKMKGEGEFLYKAGVVVWDEAQKKYVGGIYFGYNCTEDTPVIDKIIESVKLVSRKEN